MISLRPPVRNVVFRARLRVTMRFTIGNCEGLRGMIRRIGITGFVLFFVAELWAMDSGGRSQIKLDPAPKEVQLRDGGFRVGPETKIFVQFGHQSEDRIAAETLAEEIADQSGLQLDIVGAKAGNKTVNGVIMLARLQDTRVRRFLARNGLRADAAVGEDGYLLFSDKTHLIVAAKTGEGLFYGVQTLRQLLRPDGHGLLCPAVEIRDWPTLEKSNAPGDVSRDSVPAFLQKLKNEQ